MSGGGSGQPSNITQTNVQQRPAFVDGAYQTQFLPGVLANYQRPYSPYTGQRIADLNPTQQAGINLESQRALSGSPITAAAGQNITDTLNGKYLDPTTNPAWAPMAAGITNAYGVGTAAQTDAAFAQAHAFGGSAYNDAVQRNQAGLGASLAGAAGNLYNQERSNQMQAAGMAPQLANTDYTDAAHLYNAGGNLNSYQQSLLDQNVQDYTNQQNYPTSQLDMLARGLGNAMTGSYSSSQTSANPYQRSKMAGALGGGLAGAGAGLAYGASEGSAVSPGWGTLIGGLGGALAGYYS